MAEERKRWYHRSTTLVGPIWFIGWLFTIGFASLNWWQTILAIIVWPYFLGRTVGG